VRPYCSSIRIKSILKDIGARTRTIVALGLLVFPTPRLKGSESMLRLLIWFLMLTRAICTLYLNDLTGESYEVSLLDHSRSPLLGEMESLTPPYSSSTVQTPHVDHDKQLHHREQSKTQHDMSHLRSSTSRKRGLADGDSIVDPYPTPFTDNNRILGLLLNFNFGHIDPLMMIFNEYTSMCEGGWLPTVVLFTTVDWTNKLKRIVKTRNFCYRINRPLEIKAIKYPKSINIGLAAEHRKYMAMHWQDYDLFLYHEDDIIFRYILLISLPSFLCPL
jgi:hypothetical protein